VPIRDLSTKYTVLQSAFAAAERVFSLLDTPVTMLEAPNPKPLAHLNHEIVLKNVYFSFRDAGEIEKQDSDADWTLHNINLTIKKGERIGLVGATGSGKTTLLKLLNRSYDVQKGAVLIDGTDVRDFALREVRELFSVVLQDTLMFSGTIWQNLTLADRIGHDAVHKALEVVQAKELIGSLPLGLDTPVKDLGTNFSAGERQVLALARAVALDPEILLMDEATSHIDSATEAHIQAALDVLLEGRTAIIVAHRLSTVEKVDRIIVLDDGKIIQEGSHAELMAQEGAYRTLVQESQ
jgi:ATP-binding cassette subfamily B multidrug efflux pump